MEVKGERKMYNQRDIIKNLNEFNYFIDEITLNNFINNWKIEAIYEDEDGVEFFDNLAISKIKKGISLKSQGCSNEQIIYHINKLLPERLAQRQENRNLPMESGYVKGEMQNLTIDITSQTLQMIADAVAEKITVGIKDSDFVKQLFDDGVLKKDNEILSQKVQELNEDNKQLAQRVEELEKARKRSPINFEFFRRFFD